MQDGVGAQTTRCLENISIVCAAGGARLEDAVRGRVHVTDISTFGAATRHTAFFGADPLARTTIGVAALPLGTAVGIDAVVALRRESPHERERLGQAVECAPCRPV